MHKRKAGPDDWARFLSSFRPIQLVVFLEAEHTDWKIGGDAIYCLVCPDEHTHYHTSPESDAWVFRRVGGGGQSSPKYAGLRQRWYGSGLPLVPTYGGRPFNLRPSPID